MYALEPATNVFDALANHALIELDLCLARAAANTDTAALCAAAFLPVQVRPTAHEPGLRMLQLCKLHLQLTFEGACPVREDVQDELRAGQHANIKRFFQITLLGRRELVIDDEQIRMRVGNDTA